jgi:S1-C subfamily serine protease
MRLPRRTLLALLPVLAAACGEPRPPVAQTTGRIEVVDHFVEVPRSPAPAYHRDGAQVQSVAGEPWTGAGIRVGDVVASVDGRAVFGADEFRTAVGASPREVRVRSSRSGPYGAVLLDLEVRR